MGTTLEVAVEAESRAAALAASEAAIRACERVETRLSTWTSTSELARLNRSPCGRQVAVSSALEADLEAARIWWGRTGGAFDPGVGRLVALWDLRGAGRVPTGAAVQKALEGASMEWLAVRKGRATRRHWGLVIEEGGFAKGRALDAAIASLLTRGTARATLDLGGQIACVAPDGATFGLAHPVQRRATVCEIRIEGGSLATSGNSERGISVAGKRYGHLLDPRTGQPVRDFGALTVWAPTATAADCLSTGLYVLGPEAALAWAEENAGFEVVVLQAGHRRLRLRASSGLRGRLRVPNARNERNERIDIEYGNGS